MDHKAPGYNNGRFFSELASSSTVALTDEKCTFEFIGRCDDGSEDMLVSPDVAKSAAIKTIGKRTSIFPVIPKVAMQKGDQC